MSQTALLIIDVQNGLLADPSKVHDADGVLTRINELVSRARDQDVPVIFVQHEGEEGHALEKPLEGWNIHPGTGYREGDEVVEKRDCDAFQNTNLKSRLDSLGVQNLVVAGMCSEYCVDTTCRRAYSLGYDVVLATDAHTTLSNDHMSAEMIVRHHNIILGSSFAKGQQSNTIDFRN
jgi:aminoglycoside 6'-N-acetyltransferase